MWGLQRVASVAAYTATAGIAPRCLIDFWSLRILEIIAESKAASEPAPAFTSDWAMGDAMMDFLFASQDASTASLTWAIHFMSERPDILARLRAEQAAVRPNDEALSHELLEQMTYARCVVKVRRAEVPSCLDTDCRQSCKLATMSTRLSVCVHGWLVSSDTPAVYRR